MKNLIKKFIPSFLISWYHFLLAFFGTVLYRFPSRQRRGSPTKPARKLKVIGITGTGGKSTVVELAAQILKEEGYKVASISSIRFKIGNKDWKNELKMTMPGRLKLQRFLREALNAGCQYAIIEVTSEGILQHRQKFIDFDVAVFTNLFPEHIERHGSFGKYRTAKGKLFKQCKKVHILNLDDKNSEYFLKFKAERKFGFSMFRESTSKTSKNRLTSFIEARDIQESPTGLSFKVQNTKFNLNLFGKFNVQNAMAAISIGLSQDVPLEICKKALEKVKGIAGRMELVIAKPFKVIVDYAHTPDSLSKVYEILINSKFKTQSSKLICVLGSCGGGRDKWKRKILGEIAAKYCQELIVTNEDPYNENPMEIINQVAKGAVGKTKKILDRREAIREAIKLARPEDIVIITGKGSEPWMCVEKGKKIPWDDRQIVREEFKKLNL